MTSIDGIIMTGGNRSVPKFVHQNPTWVGLVSKPALRGE